MPTRADMEAATPRCDRACGPATELHPCGKPLRWHDNAMRLRAPRESDRQSGRWVCPKHLAVLSGLEAAERAGFRPMKLAA